MSTTMTNSENRSEQRDQQQSTPNGGVQAETLERKNYINPRVNIFESDESVTIEAEMPGVTKDSVDIEIDKNELTLTGHRSRSDNEGRLRFQERPSADFYRTFTLGRGVDTEKVEARMKDGILRLTLHKAEHVKKRKIAIE